ncbi:hypothetical protein KI429_07080 [Pseudomonas shirazica]|uniref:hypothetical protein n=1 Tax=Pseudomonas sp. LRP2-20 TaxID=2944234 RepID=UPI0021860664|nr:hypothetical protein [Pseudomonas sp. LRP2-20]UQB79360.1 hypothetical protein KI429_07080 [Pseudomonas shirazica]BDM22224.1 TnsA endonuclease N-terminal domain-containing protein [Pseudomonas sp. LRP2-20]
MITSAESAIKYVPRKELRKGCHGKRVTLFYSRKNDTTVACANVLQAEQCIYLEYRKDVIAYECRPPTLCQGTTVFNADFLVHLKTGSSVYYKSLSPHFREAPYAQQAMNAVETMVLDSGCFFHWVEHAQLPNSLITQNLQYLYHHSLAGSESSAQRLRQLVSDVQTNQTDLQTLIGMDVATSDICYAIFQGYLSVNLNQKLTMSTRIWRQS